MVNFSVRILKGFLVVAQLLLFVILSGVEEFSHGGIYYSRHCDEGSRLRENMDGNMVNGEWSMVNFPCGYLKGFLVVARLLLFVILSGVEEFSHGGIYYSRHCDEGSRLRENMDGNMVNGEWSMVNFSARIFKGFRVVARLLLFVILSGVEEFSHGGIYYSRHCDGGSRLRENVDSAN